MNLPRFEMQNAHRRERERSRRLGIAHWRMENRPAKRDRPFITERQIAALIDRLCRRLSYVAIGKRLGVGPSSARTAARKAVSSVSRAPALCGCRCINRRTLSRIYERQMEVFQGEGL